MSRKANTLPHSLLLFAIAALTLAPSAQANELTNPTFDSGISGWDDTFFSGPDQRAEWNGTDGGPISGPGCLEEGTTFNNGGSNGLFQQLPASPGDSFVLSGWSRVPFASPGNEASLSVTWVNGANLAIGSAGDTFNGDAGGGWHLHQSVVTAPAGTVAVRVRPSVLTVASGSEESVVHWDDLSLLPAGIFADGFASGDLTEWSGAVP